MKKSVILGATGQIGSYLVEQELANGVEVFAGYRRTSTESRERLRHLDDHPYLHWVPCDVTDPWSVYSLLRDIRPHFIYNLAAMSFVRASFDEPNHTTLCTYGGCLNVLEAMRKIGGDIRLYQASSSEMYGSAWSKYEDHHERMDITDRPPDPHETTTSERQAYQDEQTPFLPNSPYAIAKLAAHQAVRVYRKSYGLHASCGIVFNTESERRGLEFVTRKITNYVGLVANNKTTQKLQLGNLSAYRDWSHASDTARAMQLMVRQNEPDDYCIGTGASYSIEHFLHTAFALINRDWQEYVIANTNAHLRPCEVPFLRARPEKARLKLGWETTIQFEELVRRMVTHDIQRHAKKD